MKALFVSNDPTIFDPTSAARARMHIYATAIGELHIVSPALRGTKGGQEGGLILHPVHVWKFFRIPILAFVAHRIIRKYDIEVVSAQDPFEHGLIALRAIQGTSAALHVQVHTDFLSPWFIQEGNIRSPQVQMPKLNQQRRKIANDVLPRADGIRVVSERVKQSLLTRYEKNISEPAVIPVAVDAMVPALAPLPPHSFKFSLIAVGRLEPEKRFQDIFMALKIVLPHYPMVGLFIVGDGRERARLEKLVLELGLNEQVIFLGNRPDARALMASANAFIQASAYEGYGRTLLEAALAKVPIITTDVGIVGEVFKGYEDVLAVPVADPTALANSIVALIEDVPTRLKLIMAAEETARKHLATIGNLPERIAADLALVA